MLNQIIKDQESWDIIDTFIFQFKNVTLQDSYLHLIPKEYQNKILDIVIDVNDGILELGFFEKNKLIELISYNISTLEFIKKGENND